MNETLSKAILAFTSKRVHNYKWEALPDFVEQMLSLNKVVCYKCRNPIDIGSHYDCASGGRIRKYYHTPCLESLYQ